MTVSNREEKKERLQISKLKLQTQELRGKKNYTKAKGKERKN